MALAYDGPGKKVEFYAKILQITSVCGNGRRDRSKKRSEHTLDGKRKKS